MSAFSVPPRHLLSDPTTDNFSQVYGGAMAPREKTKDPAFGAK
jgi:hypothetical protein